MDTPKIYFVKPRCGWNFVDSIVKVLSVNPVLNVCRNRGYSVVEKSGCTIKELNDIFKRPDTYGVIVAGGHGDLFGPSLDPPQKDMSCQGNTKTLRSYYDPDNPDQAITDSPNPNLGFVVFHACNISGSTLGDYQQRLRKTAKQATVYGWPGQDLHSLQGLPPTLSNICRNLPEVLPNRQTSQKNVTPGIDFFSSKPGKGINAPSRMMTSQSSTSYALKPRTIRQNDEAPNQLQLLNQTLSRDFPPPVTQGSTDQPNLPSVSWQLTRQGGDNATSFGTQPLFGHRHNPFSHPHQDFSPPANPLRHMWNQGSGLGIPPNPGAQGSLRPQPSSPSPGSLQWMAQGLSSPPAFGSQGSMQSQYGSGPVNPLQQIWNQGNGFGGPPAFGSQGSLRPQQASPQPGSLPWMAQGLK